MRKLIDQQNVNAADADYPKGQTRDKSGATPGTIFANGLMGDIIQFFQKLVIDSGITENEIPDNVTNGYQLIEALDNRRKKLIPIGDWNMDTTVSVSVAHGIADWTKITSVKVLIVADLDNGLYPLGQDLIVVHDPVTPGVAEVAGSYATNATNIVLDRVTSGWYDQGGWDNTSYNRGFITIEYQI